MSVQCDVEVRPESLTPTERATARDSFVRDFERQFSNWTDIAKCCIEVERDKDYKLLGHPSFHAWLLAAAPRSRAYLYLVMGRYKELIADIPEEELAKIPLGSAGVLKQLSSKIRQDPEVRKAAKKKPSELREALKHHPGQGIETIVEKKLQFTASQWEIINGAFEKYRATDESASFETFVEWMVTEVCL